MTKRDKVQDLETALDAMLSESAKKVALLRLIQKHEGKIKLPETYIDGAIQYSEEEAQKNSNPHNQIEWLEMTLHLARAGEKVEKMQSVYAALSKLYESVNELSEAALTAKLSGNPDRANELYQKQFKMYEDKLQFAAAAKEAGFTDKAKAYQTLDRRLNK